MLNVYCILMSDLHTAYKTASIQEALNLCLLKWLLSVSSVFIEIFFTLTHDS